MEHSNVPACCIFEAASSSAGEELLLREWSASGDDARNTGTQIFATSHEQGSIKIETVRGFLNVSNFFSISITQPDDHKP